MVREITCSAQATASAVTNECGLNFSSRPETKKKKRAPRRRCGVGRKVVP